MAELQLSLDTLREHVQQGKEYTLAENFYFNNNILIGKERILSLRDLDRMDGKIYDLVRVKEYKTAGADDSIINTVLQLCVRILKEHRDYKGILAEKRKRVEKIFQNVLPSHNYVALRLSQIKKASTRLFIHSVNTAIKAIVVDIAWQARHNQGLQNSIRFEEILISSLLRNLGFLKTSRETIDAKIGDLRNTSDQLYKKVPLLSAQIIEKDSDKHDINPNIIRIIKESFEWADGSGFPEGLKNDSIHPLSLIIATASEFDLLLAGELTNGMRSYMEINRRMMSMINQCDKNTINIIGEEFRYLRDTRG